MAIQRSKYTGDPGLFSIFKGVAKVGLGLAGMLPGVGGIARGISGAIFRPAPGTTTYAQMPLGVRMPTSPTAGPGGSPNYALQGCPAPNFRDHNQQCRNPDGTRYEQPAWALPKVAQIPVPGIRGMAERAFTGGATGFMDDPSMNGMMAGRPAVSGYHWNKSGYFLQSGEYVPAGSKMVKNRRRNPANPRATSNAITRIKGAKRYAKSLSSISIRKKC